MDPLFIARVLFAATAGLHYLFVATTLGLAPIIAVLSTAAAARPSSTRDGMLRVLGRVYLANYAIGIVTGLVMELQMALVWTGPGAVAYDPIATLLALETVLAFFVESTLLGLWLVGAGILSRTVRVLLFWGVTVAAYASATFIIGANSYLHYPLDLGPGPLGLRDVAGLVGRGPVLAVLLHVTATSLLVGGFWAAAIAARVLRSSGDPEVARRLLRIGVLVVSVAAPVAISSGVQQFAVVRPRHMSPTGLFPLALVLMMLTGVLIGVLTWTVMLPLTLTGRLLRGRRWWPLLTHGVAVPLAVTLLGWLYREESRQPWFLVDRVRVADAITPVPTTQLLAMAVGFIGLGLTAACLGWRLMARAMYAEDSAAQSAPEPEPSGGWIR